MSVTERFIKYLHAQGISQNQIARFLGVKPQTINNQILRSGVSADVLCRLLDAIPSLSAEWLMRGKGEMWIKDGASCGQTAGCGSIQIGHGSAVGGSVTTNVGCDGARRGEPESGIVEELKKNVVTLKAENTLLREQLYKTQEMLMDALGKVH